MGERLDNFFHAVTGGRFEPPAEGEPFAGDPFDDGGKDPEAEARAHDALMACRDRLAAEWDPNLIKSWGRKAAQLAQETAEPAPSQKNPTQE